MFPWAALLLIVAVVAGALGLTTIASIAGNVGAALLTV
jgi:uncharacterized membrane protein YtjA (UPF0391 family)